MLFGAYEAALTRAGFLAMGGQIVDASIIAAPKLEVSSYSSRDHRRVGIREPPIRPAMKNGRKSGKQSLRRQEMAHLFWLFFPRDPLPSPDWNGYRPFRQARHDSSLDEQDARRSSGLAHSRGSDGYPEREGWCRRRYRANALESFAAARQYPLEHIQRHGPSA